MDLASVPFLSAAALTALSLRYLPARPGRAVHLLGSLCVWGYVLGDPSSLVAGAIYTAIPYLAVVVFGAGRGLLAPLVVTAQLVGFLWLRGGLSFVADGFGVGVGAIHVIGVSYITLRQLDWLLNLDPRSEQAPSLSSYLHYTLSLYSILAGPIARHEDFDASLHEPRHVVPPAQWLAWMHRVVNGLIKVMILAPVLGRVTSHAFVSEQEFSAGARLLSFYGYPVYIFLNFSGYCDVVISLAAMAGLELPENFNRPFLATNVQDFWQRWHMSLSSWLRDYVFFTVLHTLRVRAPRLPPSVASALCVTGLFILVGLWHGPTPAYALFGLLHGLAAAALIPYGKWLDRLLSDRGARIYREHLVMRGLRIGACFHFVCATTSLFERSIPQAAQILFGPA